MLIVLVGRPSERRLRRPAELEPGYLRWPAGSPTSGVRQQADTPAPSIWAAISQAKSPSAACPDAVVQRHGREQDNVFASNRGVGWLWRRGRIQSVALLAASREQSAPRHTERRPIRFMRGSM